MNKLLFTKVEEAFREALSASAPEFREWKVGRRAAGSLSYKWGTAAGVCFLQLYAPRDKDWITVKTAWSQDDHFPKELDAIDFIETKNRLLGASNDLVALDALPAVLLTPADFGVVGGGWDVPEVSPAKAALILDNPSVQKILTAAGVANWRAEAWLHSSWDVLDGYALECGLDRLDESDAVEVLSTAIGGINEFLRYRAVPYLRELMARKIERKIGGGGME